MAWESRIPWIISSVIIGNIAQYKLKQNFEELKPIIQDYLVKEPLFPLFLFLTVQLHVLKVGMNGTSQWLTQP